jgi:hypothetical protein
MKLIVSFIFGLVVLAIAAAGEPEKVINIVYVLDGVVFFVECVN